jgi:prepilin peptidase CpaA
MPDETHMWANLQNASAQAAWPGDDRSVFIAGPALPLSLQTLILGVLAVLVAWTAISDLRTQTIPNTAVTAIFVLWVGWVISGADVQVLQSLGIGLVIFAVGAILFHRGQVGGGDVKLLTVLGIWAGPQEALVFLIHVALAGGVLTMAYVMHMRFVAPALGRAVTIEKKRFVPYAVAISAGALLLISRLWAG